MALQCYRSGFDLSALSFDNRAGLGLGFGGVLSSRKSTSSRRFSSGGWVLSDSDLDKRETIFALIGMIVVTWAYAEDALLETTLLIWDHSGIVVSGHKTPPVSMSKKLDYLNGSLKKATALHALKDLGIGLKHEFTALKADRELLAHGFMEAADDGTLLIRNTVISGDARRLIERTLTANDLAISFEKISDLANRAAIFNDAVRDVFGIS
jgi:hypothetical protein